MLSVVDISGHGDVWTLIYHTSEAEKRPGAEKEPARQKRGQRDRKGTSKTEKGPARQKRNQRDRKGASETEKGPRGRKYQQPGSSHSSIPTPRHRFNRVSNYRN
ncbi:hypothetical protein M8J75_001333 [Diaphorina citri]|nr:hypothetical protein M8J75_001333 [Diaphorina citri]